ncbi:MULTISPECIES: hypothetical protein [Haloferax]|uniref:DUF7508 domain-containing protein n=1 Tax=Haloferax marinum TaxID=2666143 RepID=A0A6A8G3G7_9EURY|nr:MULTISPECIES: hypothetical protein [Haloferax]KAB1196443.1 hypothetical protein Hfx1150_02475 [Haloferax sp. CBA1150]MRW95439.1 hypothetical protein [Haloferax marinum]
MLRKRWEPLEKRTIGKAPEAYGYYELGDADGNLVGRGVGVLRDELKEVLAYGDGERVRWERATSLDHAERIAAEHDPE